MEYFVDANINFKGKINLEEVDKAIKEAVGEEDFTLEISDKAKDRLTVRLGSDFDFWSVEDLVKAVLSTGLKKFGRDKLVAYQATADCYFKNYVTKAGQFLDFCGDCVY